jgi:hypothetical protein
MCEQHHLRMFGPWNALQQLVAGPAKNLKSTRT